jgi:hypothetical protein
MMGTVKKVVSKFAGGWPTSSNGDGKAGDDKKKKVVYVTPAATKWWKEIPQGDGLEFHLADKQLLDWMEMIRDHDGHGVENAGYGVHEYDDKGNVVVPWFTVADDPTASSGGVETDMNAAQIESFQAGYDGRVTLQWHTHPNFGTFWSGTDHKGMMTMVQAQQRGRRKGEVLFLVLDEFNWMGTVVRWDGDALSKHDVAVIWRGRDMSLDHDSKSYRTWTGTATVNGKTISQMSDEEWADHMDQYWASKADEDTYGKYGKYDSGLTDDDDLTAESKHYNSIWDEEDEGDVDLWFAGYWSDDPVDYEPLMKLFDVKSFSELYLAWQGSQLPHYVEYHDMVNHTSMWEEVAEILGQKMDWSSWDELGQQGERSI